MDDMFNDLIFDDLVTLFFAEEILEKEFCHSYKNKDENFNCLRYSNCEECPYYYKEIF